MKAFAVLASAFVLLASPVAAQNYPALQGRPVIDAANIIPADREARLNEMLLEYERTTGHQLAIATVPSLEDYAIEEYSIGYARELALGSRDADDGVLLLVAPNERKARIEVGDGLEPILTDAASALIIQNTMIPRFKEENYPLGIEEGARAIMAQTQMDNAAIADLQSRAAVAAKARAEANAQALGDFLITSALVIGGIIGAIALYFVITAPARRRRREKEAAAYEAARQAAAAHRAKLYEDNRIAREKELARQRAVTEKKARDRANMLAAMTPTQRHRFLEEERLAAEAAAAAAALAAALAAERARIAAAERKVRDAAEDAAKRRREENNRRNDDTYGGGIAIGGGGGGDTYGGGGGNFSGGGADGSW